ncbi:syntaxin-1B like protein [Danaus plexippus plexippus]|uniref:Syntaxin-1B like protein n=1 Tax=Danaus plexippus plexippus TaxID=278856 RepID=A0A212F225_DANPL|nr:syntaxin-1B like protein [Danaus plexippus plexippus]
MRSRDRLDELRRLASSKGQECEVLVEPPALPAPQTHLDGLLKEVEQIRAWVQELESNTRLVRRLHSDPTYHNDKQLQEQLDSLVTRSNALGTKALGALRQLEAREREAGRGAEEWRGAAARIVRLQYAATRRLTSDALDRHTHALQLLKDYQLSLLKDQINIASLAITDEECEQLLESNNVSLFVDNLRAETAEARLALREAEARRDELQRVESSLKTVRDLFTQLAHLVATQQEHLDSVEYFASQATEHVECGGQELLKGTISRKKAKKKKMGLIICLASGVLIVLMVLIYT